MNLINFKKATVNRETPTLVWLLHWYNYITLPLSVSVTDYCVFGLGLPKIYVQSL